MGDFINLDHAATTAPTREVADAMHRCMLDCCANPSSPYAAAGDARRVMRESRSVLSDMIGAAPQEIFFTSGGTEANNWALRQAAGRHVVLSAIEHKSVLLAAQNQGCTVSCVTPSADGMIFPEAVAAAVRPDTALVSVQLVNNEVGTVQPIAAIAHALRRPGLLFHCDAVQGVGQLPIDVHALGVDMLSASAHKLYGPRGIGFLYVRQGVATLPLLAGGGQEFGRRAGTENVAAIHGFAVAAESARQDMEARAARAAQLRTLLLRTLAEQHADVTELAAGAPHLPSITSLLLPMSSEEMIARLDLRGIAVAGGAACGSHSGEPSHVLLAMGLSAQQASSVIRISTGRHTTEQDILTAAAAIADILRSR